MDVKTTFLRVVCSFVIFVFVICAIGDALLLFEKIDCIECIENCREKHEISSLSNIIQISLVYLAKGGRQISVCWFFDVM